MLFQSSTVIILLALLAQVCASNPHKLFSNPKLHQKVWLPNWNRIRFQYIPKYQQTHLSLKSFQLKAEKTEVSAKLEEPMEPKSKFDVLKVPKDPAEAQDSLEDSQMATAQPSMPSLKLQDWQQEGTDWSERVGFVPAFLFLIAEFIEANSKFGARWDDEIPQLAADAAAEATAMAQAARETAEKASATAEFTGIAAAWTAVEAAWKAPQFQESAAGGQWTASTAKAATAAAVATANAAIATRDKAVGDESEEVWNAWEATSEGWEDAAFQFQEAAQAASELVEADPALFGQMSPNAFSIPTATLVGLLAGLFAGSGFTCAMLYVNRCIKTADMKPFLFSVETPLSARN